MNNPDNLKYSKTHEWARLEDDGSVAVGITEHAQELLGDMVFIELPAQGRKLEAGAECAVVESVKAAADVYAPVAGEVLSVNRELEGAPEKINQDPYGSWLFKLRPDNAADLDAMLSAGQYQEMVDTEER